MTLYLPHDELVSELGEVGTRALLGAFGGKRLYVPASPGPQHQITKAIGAENAAKVAAMVATGIGGLIVELPLGEASSKSEARRRLDELASDASLSEKQIATALKVHIRTVRRARARLQVEVRPAA